MAALSPEVGAGDWSGCLPGTQPDEERAARGETNGVEAERDSEADGAREHACDRREHDLAEHGGGPDAAVGGDELFVLDEPREEGTGGGTEEDRPCGEPERDGVGGRDVVVVGADSVSRTEGFPLAS